MLQAIVLLPLLSAAVVGLFRNTWSKRRVSAVACSSVGISFGLVLILLAQFLGNQQPIHATLTTWGKLLDLGLVADSLSLWWMLVVTGCGFLIHVYATGYMHDDPSFGRFMAKLNFFIYAMSLLVLSDNFAGLFWGWANVGLASYMLIGFYIKKPAAGAAAMKAFVINMIGEVGLLAGIAFIYAHYGSLKFDTVFAAVAKNPAPATLIAVLLLVAACAKSAQLPLHTWLPNAMEGPTPVSALIHAATMVTAGVYLVSRVHPIYDAAPSAALIVAWVGALGALFGAVVASGQFDIKRVLAFSTLSQVGYMFLGNGLGAFTGGAGYIAADFHFFTHAFFKAALFLCAGIVVHHYNGDQDIRHMGGLKEKDPFAWRVFLVGALALIGVPGFAGFFSKDEILLAAWHYDKLLFVIGILAAGMTAFYNVRLLSLVFLGTPYTARTKALGKKNASAKAGAHDHGHEDQHHETPAAMKWPVAILAVLSVVSGWLFFTHTHIHFLETSYAGLKIEAEGINIVVAVLATGVAAIGALVAWYLYGPEGSKRELERDTHVKGGIRYNMFYFDAIYDAIIVTPVKGIAEFCSNVADTRLIDGFVNGLGTLAAGVGSLLRQLQGGYLRRYALTVFTGVALLLAYYLYV